MPRPRLEVADVFRRYGAAHREAHGLTGGQQRVMRAIERCRTAALGGHLERCAACGHERPAYDSCLMGSDSLWGALCARRLILLGLTQIRPCVDSP